MGKVAKYTQQMPVVTNVTQESLVIDVANKIGDYKAPVVREALNQLFGLVDEELPEGVDRDALVNRIAEQMRPGITKAAPDAEPAIVG